jgi:perosamine synthetase
MGEGGSICTNDEHAYNWLKQARHHGISKDGWKRYQTLNKWQYEMEFVGWKYNPSDVLASILSVQIDKYDEIHNERQRCVDLYNQILGYNNQGMHVYPVLVSDRAKFMEEMAKDGIQCSVHFQPLHKMSAFKECKKNNLDKTEFLGEHLVSLPLFPDLTNNEIKFICQTILKTDLLMPSSDWVSSATSI